MVIFHYKEFNQWASGVGTVCVYVSVHLCVEMGVWVGCIYVCNDLTALGRMLCAYVIPHLKSHCKKLL